MVNRNDHWQAVQLAQELLIRPMIIPLTALLVSLGYVAESTVQAQTMEC